MDHSNMYPRFRPAMPHGYNMMQQMPRSHGPMMNRYRPPLPPMQPPPPPPPEEENIHPPQIPVKPPQIPSKPPPPSTTEEWWLSELNSMHDTDPLKHQLQSLIKEDWFIGLSTIQQIECWQHKMQLKSQKVKHDLKKYQALNITKAKTETAPPAVPVSPIREGSASMNNFSSPVTPQERDPSPVEIPEWDPTQRDDVVAKKNEYKAHYDRLVKKAEVFNTQYKEWQKQFDEWKNKHKMHPNKSQFVQYENQWRKWEEEMLKQTSDNKAKMERLQYNIDSIDKYMSGENNQNDRYYDGNPVVHDSKHFASPISLPQNNRPEFQPDFQPGRYQPRFNRNPTFNNPRPPPPRHPIPPYQPRAEKMTYQDYYSDQPATEMAGPSTAVINNEKQQVFPTSTLPTRQFTSYSTNHTKSDMFQNYDRGNGGADPVISQAAHKVIHSNPLFSGDNYKKLGTQLENIRQMQKQMNEPVESEGLRSTVLQKAKKLSSTELLNLLSAVQTVSRKSNAPVPKEPTHQQFKPDLTNLYTEKNLEEKASSVHVIDEAESNYDNLLEECLKFDPHLKQELLLRSVRDTLLLEEAKAIDPTYGEDLNRLYQLAQHENLPNWSQRTDRDLIPSTDFPNDYFSRKRTLREEQNTDLDYLERNVLVRSPTTEMEGNSRRPYFNEHMNENYTRPFYNHAGGNPIHPFHKHTDRNAMPPFHRQMDQNFPRPFHNNANENPRHSFQRNTFDNPRHPFHNPTVENPRHSFQSNTAETNRHPFQKHVDQNTKTYPKQVEKTQPKVKADDILCLPGRLTRPSKIVIILRGLPGSGKSRVAKIIRDRENSFNVSARVLSLDDYFITEVEKPVKDPDTGKTIKQKVFEYLYEPEMEEVYRANLLKTFKKTLDDGLFTFIVLDSVNEKVQQFFEFYHCSKQNGFEVFIAEMEEKLDVCVSRNIHNRTLNDIASLQAKWESTPDNIKQIDLMDMGDTPSKEAPPVENTSPDTGNTIKDSESKNSQESSEQEASKSKWETESATSKLDQLDGIKKKVATKRSMDDFLSVTEDYTSRLSAPGKKRVRWADMHVQENQKRMRDVGFVVGQTKWHEMMDKNQATRALNQTKLI